MSLATPAKKTHAKLVAWRAKELRISSESFRQTIRKLTERGKTN
jgi:hypothetical protein